MEYLEFFELMLIFLKNIFIEEKIHITQNYHFKVYVHDVV